MRKINKGTGAGGAKTNLNGIDFEQNTYLAEWIEEAGYTLEAVGSNTARTQYFKIFENKRHIAYYGRQSRIYECLKAEFPDEMTNEHIKEVLSKKINPDAFIYNIAKKKLVIFEKKWQQSSGSVDEKIQTAPFKLAMFEKLTRNMNVTVMYQYILSPWFKRDEYRNVKEYYSNNDKIDIWTKEENMNKFSISAYL